MIKRFYKFMRELITCWSEDKVSTYSASLAYYTIFALTPLIIICTGIIGLAFGRELAEKQIFDYITLLIGPNGSDQIQTMIKHASSPITGIKAGIVSFIVLIIGASGIFSQIQLGLNEIWGIKEVDTGGFIRFIKDRFLSFIVVISVSLLLLASLLLSITLAFMSKYLDNFLPVSQFTSWFLDPLISIMGITVLFALLYKILPDVKQRWSQVWLGSVISALLFTGGKFLLSLYLGTLRTENAYGPAGSVIVILIWVYFSAQILFIGAEIIKVQCLMQHKEVIPIRNSVLIKEE